MIFSHALKRGSGGDDPWAFRRALAAPLQHTFDAWVSEKRQYGAGPSS